MSLGIFKGTDQNCNLYDYLIPQLNLENVYDSVEALRASTHAYKVGLLYVRWPDPDTNDSILSELLEFCDKIIFIGLELHDNTAEFVIKHDHPKIVYYLSGYINTPMKYARVKQYMQMLQLVAYVYSTSGPKSDLEQILPYTEKPLLFDALLGTSKPHRDFVYDNISNSALRDKTYLRYYSTPGELTQNKNFDFANLNISPILGVDLIHTYLPVNYFGNPTQLSTILPIEIFKKTAYSIVTETCFTNHYSHITEKIAKPLISKRLFVVFSGQYYLRNLKNLGFRTFDGIIDESYDNEPDHITRWTMAFSQLAKLTTMTQQEVYSSIRDIVEHNYTLVNRQAHMVDLLQDELTEYLN